MTVRFALNAATIDLARREVLRGTDVLPLSELESRLLEWLVEHPGQPASRERLLVEVWGFPKPVETRAVDNTVVRLRMKIEANPRRPDHLKTIRGRGYVLDLPTAPVPTRASAAGRRPVDRLPAPTTPFRGRGEELATLAAQVEGGTRLVVVTGSGGAGKTRLVARWLEQAAPPTVAVLTLTEVRGRSEWLDAVCNALNVTTTTEDPVEDLGRFLAGCSGVLVLDNLEHLRDAVAECLPRWLHAAPGLQIVATSRVRLGLADEHVCSLGPLREADATSNPARSRLASTASAPLRFARPPAFRSAKSSRPRSFSIARIRWAPP